MALPAPTYTFILPSIHDGTTISCRLYLPTKVLNASTTTSWTKKGAIFAHPYAPLGGSCDDLIVHTVGSELLRAGYVVGTFNFRGAGDSGGRTSWTARPELSDYVSFYGFMIYFLEYLELGRLHEPQHASNDSKVSPTSIEKSGMVDKEDAAPARAATSITLGGYSYGSMIASHVPSVDVVVETFTSAPLDSAENGILSRAGEMATRATQEMAARNERRGRSLEVSGNSSHCTAVGGPSPESGSRKSSQEAERSVGSLKRGLSRKIRRSHQQDRHRDQDIARRTQETQASRKITPNPSVRYLLVSPLLPPVSLFTSMFSKITFNPKRRPEMMARQKDLNDEVDVQLITHPSLVIYGDHDAFTAAQKLLKWCETLATRPESKFQFEEIEGAGHFWHEEGSTTKLKTVLRNWL